MFTNRIAGKTKFAPRAVARGTRRPQTQPEVQASNSNTKVSDEPTVLTQPITQIDQTLSQDHITDSLNDLTYNNDTSHSSPDNSNSADAYPFDLTPQTSAETSPQPNLLTNEIPSIMADATNSKLTPITNTSSNSYINELSFADILAQNYQNAVQEAIVPDSSNEVLQYQISQATQISALNKAPKLRRIVKKNDPSEDPFNFDTRPIAKPRAPRKPRAPNTSFSSNKRASYIYEPQTLNFMNSYESGALELNSFPLKVLCNQHVLYGEGFISANNGSDRAIVHDLSNDPAPSQIQKPTDSSDSKSTGPQFKIGEDGKLVLDLNSLKAPKRLQPQMNVDPSQPITIRNSDHYYNCMTHVKRNKTSRWTQQDTETFYHGLTEFGTDFSAIATLFENRNRAEIKNKFNREEKKFPDRVTDALLSKPRRSRLTTPAPSVDSDSSRSDMTPSLLTPPASEPVPN